MGIPLLALPRPLVVGLMGLSAVAIAVGRRDERPPERRDPAHARYAIVDSHLLGRDDGAAWLLDSDRGRLLRMGSAGADRLSHASCSPWRDGRGDWQVVGRSRERVGRGAAQLGRGFGLARWTFPGGRLLDRIETEVFPVGPPCWLPGASARVLFAAGDGRLYRFAFEAAPGPESSADEPDTRPLPLAWWRIPLPGKNPVLSDPSLPADPRLGGRLLVALSVAEEGGRVPLWQVWWLQVDAAATAIVAAGRLTRPGPEDAHERFPALAIGPDGGMVLAFLVHRPGDRGYQLRLAPIQVEPRTGVPSVAPGEAAVLADGCLPLHPAVSEDGRWISCIVRPPGSAPTARRLEVALRNPHPTPSHDPTPAP
jgi:hypothetical protein